MDEDDDFVTPAEHFEKSKLASVQIDGKKNMFDKAVRMQAEDVKKRTTKRNREIEVLLIVIYIYAKDCGLSILITT